MEPWITKKQNLKSKRKHTMKKEKAEGPLLEPPFQTNVGPRTEIQMQHLEFNFTMYHSFLGKDNFFS